jgi:hypothetical protein
MWTRKKSIGSRAKRTRRKQSKFLTPDLALVAGKLMPFVAGPYDPLKEAERLGQEYTALANDYDAAVSQFLQRAYAVAAEFRQLRGDFKRFQVHAFWKQLGQKPRDPKTSKWILYFLMQATTAKERHLANKYASVLDRMQADQVENGAVAARIKELGGIEAAYEAMRRPDESSSPKIGESVMPEPTKPARRSLPTRTLPVYPLVALPFAEEKTQPNDDGDENKIAWGEDAFSFVQRLARMYARMDEGDDKSVTRFLQDAYWAALRVKSEPDQFERLKADPFWEDWWQKPNNASTSKWVLYFIMRAKTTEVRILATKYAVFLNDYLQWNSSSSIEILQTIKHNGGFEGAYEALRARKRAFADWGHGRR